MLSFLHSPTLTSIHDYWKKHSLAKWTFVGRVMSLRFYMLSTLPTKVHLVKAMVFPMVMYGCESWTVNKAELRRIDDFELWCWRRLLRVPWIARRSNQSILKEISPGCSLEAMMLKLKLQYFGHLLRRVDSLEKTDAGRDWGQEEKGMTEDEMAGWHYWLDGCESEWTLGDGQSGLACCDSWGCKESDMTERLNWTEDNPVSLDSGTISWSEDNHFSLILCACAVWVQWGSGNYPSVLIETSFTRKHPPCQKIM